MAKVVYGHSHEDKPEEEWQTLWDHSEAVAAGASQFAQAFGSENWAWNLGLLHDIGKIDPTFQAYLRRCNGLDDKDYDVAGQGKVNHSSAGMAFALEHYGPMIGDALAYIIAGHHAGLPDWDNAEAKLASICGRKAEGAENLGRIQAQLTEYTNSLRSLEPPPGMKRNTFHFWVRMLFSCLVDADYLDTEAFMEPERSQQRGGYLGMSELKQCFDQFMEKKARDADATPLNAIRANILKLCRETAAHAPGLYSLTVPTGGGKTLSAMAFALEHAAKYQKSRIVYVIPYTSIIEQTAAILSEIFGADQVIEHHSNLAPEKETQRVRLASENWDAPVIVTTNVQFFESLFAAKPSRCRKLHNLVNSVIILDEAQMLPTEKLSPCVSALNALTESYGATIVLATATQPALTKLPEKSQSLGPVREIVDDVPDLYEKLKRVNYHFPQELNEPGSWEGVAEQLKQHESVLCIVNKRKDCYDLFNLMPEGTIHLSALMCGQHRSEIIAQIKSDLKAKKPVRVISTQLVEAGVDIDFPVVYRALAGLDSIAQAAGRCNREGRLGAGDVYVFVPPTPAPTGLLLKGEDTTREMLHTTVDMNSPGCYQDYFTRFYHKANDLGLKFHEWLEKGVPDIRFRTAGQEFNLIDNPQRAVIVNYGDSAKWIRKLVGGGPTREIMRQLQRYTVSLPIPITDILLSDGRLILANPENDNDIILQGTIKYDPVFGLDIYNEQLPVEDLII